MNWVGVTYTTLVALDVRSVVRDPGFLIIFRGLGALFGPELFCTWLVLCLSARFLAIMGGNRVCCGF